jgi:hypothetical protein
MAGMGRTRIKRENRCVAVFFPSRSVSCIDLEGLTDGFVYSFALFLTGERQVLNATIDIVEGLGIRVSFSVMYR